MAALRIARELPPEATVATLMVDTGLKYLAKALEHRCFEVLALNVDPRFATVRKEPRFAKLVRPVGLV